LFVADKFGVFLTRFGISVCCKKSWHPWLQNPVHTGIQLVN